MWRMLIPALLVAGCAQLPPTPEDIQAKRFEAVPGKSVVYVVRRTLDSDGSATILIDGKASITTMRGTYYRWEVDPGTHRFTGMGIGGENVTLTTAPGQIYFLQHQVMADRDDGAVTQTALQQVDDQTGRALVARATLLR